MAEFIALSILILLFSVILHEVAHGLAAKFFGDFTAENSGRLTLNPLPHIDPIGTILLPLLAYLYQSPVLIGWAKPVPVNPLNFSDIKKGELVVSLAGVSANFGLAVLGALIIHLLKFIHFSSPFVFGIFDYLVNINLALGIFNLLPIPPLDGAKVVMSQLPYSKARQFASFERFGPIILMVLLFTNIGGISVVHLIMSQGISLLKSLLFL